eukprot:6889676-Pyramimonas_sp.AAC.1
MHEGKGGRRGVHSVFTGEGMTVGEGNLLSPFLKEDQKAAHRYAASHLRFKSPTVNAWNPESRVKPEFLYREYKRRLWATWKVGESWMARKLLECPPVGSEWRTT